VFGLFLLLLITQAILPGLLLRRSSTWRTCWCTSPLITLAAAFTLLVWWPKFQRVGGLTNVLVLACVALGST
jgi:hypothetical protein